MSVLRIVLSLAALIGIGVLLWRQPDAAPRAMEPRPVSADPAPPSSTAPATAAPQRRPRTIRPAPPALGSVPADADAPVRAAEKACAETTGTQVSLTVTVDLPDARGEYPALAWCQRGRLNALQILRGDDAWISWTPTPAGVERTVVEFGDDALPRGYRTVRGGVEVERGVVERDQGGRELLSIHRDGQLAQRVARVEGAIGDSSAAVIEAWLDDRGVTGDVRARQREMLTTFDAEKIEEHYEDDRLTRRSQTNEADLGEGRREMLISSDNDGDGRLDSVIVSHTRIDETGTTLVMARDRDFDGTFDTLMVRGPGLEDDRAIDWPHHSVTAARLRALLPQ